MQNTEDASADEQPTVAAKPPFLKTNMPLILGAGILVVCSFILGYSVGHKQGLTAVGYDADAEQLVEVVQKQKVALDTVNKNLNLTVQERDVAVNNANELYEKATHANNARAQFENMSNMYREILLQRGGLNLTIQDLAIKPLPENIFEYQLDLMQVSPNKLMATGSVEIRLIRGGQVLQVPLQNKSFHFENFERLTGRWTMPKGFVPQYVEVRLNGTNNVVKRFSWERGKPLQAESTIVAEIPQAQANAN